ncbi:hypothetical protein X824_gp015 [Escherichia phage 4MG]|uniref:Hyphothetical protein n=1 Tax=Escherichia phage 4MG TaxID=1391428 RepID=V5KSA5_9CAUD|nr:hypothetical protein X824_gp015 [Escherichia phage 4MG]AGZ17489.1 hyphothetical protein [Escherichia phage 4MG]
MKVKGTQTTVQTVDVELGGDAIKTVVYSREIDYLAKALQEKLLHKFLHSLEPKFTGSRTVRKGYGRYDGKLVLVHVDADWNYHNNVGEDEDIRALTDEEEVLFKMISGVSEYIENLKK